MHSDWTQPHHEENIRHSTLSECLVFSKEMKRQEPADISYYNFKKYIHAYIQVEFIFIDFKFMNLIKFIKI